MSRKYEFTGETKVFLGITLKRIKRVSDGELGGWIEKGIIYLTTFQQVIHMQNVFHFPLDKNPPLGYIYTQGGQGNGISY